MVTIFKNVLETKNPFYTSLDIIVDRIKTGNSKSLIEKIRLKKDIKDRHELKKGLPSILFSGKFTQRGNDYKTTHSGLAVIDFDHIENLEEKKKQLCNDKFTNVCFVSPSGDGLKVVVKIPSSFKTHRLSLRALTKYFECKEVDHFEDESRVCYESYDPGIYYNKESQLFNKLIEEKEIKSIINPVDIVNDSDEIIDRLEKWLSSKGENYTDGNKHSYLVKLSSGCLRFGVNYADTCTRLRYGYSNRSGAGKVDPLDIEKIVKAIYKNFNHLSCTAHFEKTGKPIITVTKKEVAREILDFELPLKDVVLIDSVKDSMMNGFINGTSKGHTTYFPSFDKHFTFRKREISLLGGLGNIGKTTMFKNMAILQAINTHAKFAWFGPEEYPADDFYNDLIHTYVGKSTEPYHPNQMTQSEYLNAMDFIGKHFFYIYPEDASPTPEYINSRFLEMIKKENITFCVTDPFNQLDNDWKKQGRDDLYISDFLSKEKRFSQENNIYKIILAHPSGAVGYDKNGIDKKCPDQYNLAGGAMWNNKCDNILMYHRPLHLSEPNDNMCIWVSQKIKKRKLTGTPGQCSMFFDFMTNRFYDADGYCPFEKRDITLNPNKLNPTEPKEENEYYPLKEAPY